MIINGVPCSIKKVKKGSGFKNGKPQYLITIYKKILNHKRVSCKETGTKDFLCFTMPKGTLITRLDGKVAFTGNCVWFMNHIETGWAEDIWLKQGGANTIKSYKSHGYKYNSMPKTHTDFFNKGVYYYELNNMLFVHGGFDYPTMPWDDTMENLVWDRELLNRAKCGLKIKEWKKVFLGHTSTEMHGSTEPAIIDMHPGKFAKVFQIDCGAGWRGKLCLMDIDTEEYFLSDLALELNPRGHR